MSNYIKPPGFARLVSGKNVIWEIPSQEKILYLTFDDGPIPNLTPAILQILSQYNVKATFFCVGENIKKHPDVFKQIIDQGHHIGNHTYNHLNGWKTANDKYVHNVNLFKKHYQTNLFRPPYGKIKPIQILRISSVYKIIMWSVLTYDFDQRIDGEQCYKNAIENITNGSIVVFHDNIKASERVLYALPKFLSYCLENGYTFRLISPDLPLRRRKVNRFNRRLIKFFSTH